MEQVVDESFRRLELAARGESAEFDQAVLEISTNVVGRNQPGSWFGKVYSDYKLSVKAARRFENLRPMVTGERILDFGCGDGLLSYVFFRHGFKPLLTDVLDYRASVSRDLPFEVMPNSRSLPFAKDAADTALVMAVLHHVELSDLGNIIDEFYRVSRRVIVEEDTCGLPPDLPSLKEALKTDQFLREYLRFRLDDQYRIMMFVDYFANIITQGIAEMDMPFNFRTVPEWIALFEQHGFRTAQVRVMGFQPKFFNRSCHVWFVFDRE